MFTLKKWTPPEIPANVPPEVRDYLREQNRSIAEYLRGLDEPSAIAIEDGTFDGAVGSNTPATGAFTTVDASSYGSFGNDAVVFGKASSSLAANADLDITTTASGLYVLRNNTDGGIIVFSVEMGLGAVTVISDPSAYAAVGADPGAASNKFWLAVTGTTFRIRNRYAVAKSVGLSILALGGTPA